MKFTFKANIYKVGINPCVDVPLKISGSMKASKGYIPVKGKIKTFSFKQTLVPVKNAPYRLYVNGLMLKGSGAAVGDIVKFIIEQDNESRTEPMPGEFKKRLDAEGLLPVFKKLTAGRQKEILRYLNFLKTKEALERNIIKIIEQLKNRPF